jgi:multiple sugar transport system substrate-binding protein
MKRIIVFLLGVAVLAVFVFAGCSKQQSGTSAGENIVLKISFQNTWKGVQDEYIKKALEESYYPVHPNIKVEFVYYPENELLGNILAKHAAGGSDEALFTLPLGSVSIVAQPGAVSDITQRVKNSSVVGKPDYFFESITENACVYNGKWYGLPFEVDGRVLAYNKSMFDEWGVKPPTTIGEMIEIMKVAKSHGVAGYGVPWSVYACPLFDLGIFYYCDGGEFVVSDGAGWYKAAFEGQAAEDYLKFARDVQQYMPNDFITYDWDKTHAGFGAGRFAMMWIGPWFYGQLGGNIPQDFNYGFVKVPTGKVKSATTLGGWIYGINSDSPYQDETFELLEFLCSPAVSAKTVAAMSAVRDAYNYPPMNDPKYEVFSVALNDARPILGDGCGLGTIVGQAFGPEFQRVVFESSGNIKADVAACNAVIQQVLDTNKPK